MAPRKPSEKDHKDIAPNKSTASTGAGVVKRRYKAVRFHEDGLLNVERKTGKYFKMAQQNQRQSPLLRLPAELRNKIFAYALGGRTFEIAKTARYLENITKFKHALALLQVCRQIYAETTLLPFSTSIFSVEYPFLIEVWAKSFHRARTQSITWIRMSPWYPTRLEILVDEFDTTLFEFDKPLVFPEISNHGGVVIPIKSYGNATREPIRKLAMRIFQERNEGINFVLE